MRLNPLLSVGMLLLATACGGSGGGGGTPLGNAAFTGTYRAADFGGSMTASIPFASSLAGPWTANGDGTGTFGFTLNNRNGTILAIPSPIATTSLVDSDGAFTANIGVTTYAGGVASDGDVLALADLTAGDAPAILLALKTSGVYGTASLVGTYFLGSLFHSGVSQVVSLVGQVSFDGLGAVTAIGPAAYVNVNGAVSSAPILPGTYSVAADGTVSLSLSGSSLTGGLLANGDLALLSGGTISGQAPAMAILIRAGVGLGAGTFSGSYWIAGIECSLPGFPGPPTPYTRITALQGTAIANGGGNVSFPSTALNAETVITSTSAAYDYAVGSDGGLTTIVSGIPTGPGAVSPDGRFAFVGGDAVPGQPPRLTFFVRK